MKIINILCIRRNNTEFAHLASVAVNAENADVQVTQWRVPEAFDGRLKGFKYVSDGAKPTADSVKVLRIFDKISNQFFWAAIPDTATSQVWADAVNSCCDDPVNMPAVVLPPIFIETTGCLVSSTYTYSTYTQDLVSGQVYTASASKNAVLLAAVPAAGFASLAALNTWAGTNWTAYTLTVAGLKVSVAAVDALTGSISVEIRNYFESGADASVASGHHYTLDALVNGVALPTLTGVADGDTSTIAALANADATWAQYGQYSVVANKIRLVAYDNVDTATLTLTEV